MRPRRATSVTAPAISCRVDVPLDCLLKIPRHRSEEKPTSSGLMLDAAARGPCEQGQNESRNAEAFS